MKQMKHEAVAKDLARRALKLLRSKEQSTEIEILINSSTHYLRKAGETVELWSAEKLAEIPHTASEQDAYDVFIGYLNRWMSKNYPIEYAVL